MNSRDADMSKQSQHRVNWDRWSFSIPTVAVVLLALTVSSCTENPGMPEDSNVPGALVVDDFPEVSQGPVEKSTTQGIRFIAAFRTLDTNSYEALYALEPMAALRWDLLRIAITMDIRSPRISNSTRTGRTSPLGPPDDPRTVERIVSVSVHSDQSYSDASAIPGAPIQPIEINAQVSNFFGTSPLLAGEEFQPPASFVEAIEDVPRSMVVRLKAPLAAVGTHDFTVFITLSDGRMFEASTGPVALSP